MLNFTYYNPVRIIFGKDTIKELASLVPEDVVTMITYGGGSIKKNGVYDQVKKALGSRKTVEFSGIEPNPVYETLMRAVEMARQEKAGFLLAVGGGSVLDGTKFIAAAISFKGADPWEIVSKNADFESAVPLASVLTLPATGSEMNCFSVVSRSSTREKLAFANPKVFPVFSILDPETTYSLPQKQVRNGIVDAFVHVMEQYMTMPSNAPLQDRQSEALLLTLLEEGPKTLKDPEDYDSRASLVWSATHALNGVTACGVPQDWTTHEIGHELTALYGIDHAESLAVVLPAVWKYRKEQKKAKLLQYADRIWGIKNGSDDNRIKLAIDETIRFFHSLQMPTALRDFNIPVSAAQIVAERIEKRGTRLGEHGDIAGRDIEAILKLAV